MLTDAEEEAIKLIDSEKIDALAINAVKDELRGRMVNKKETDTLPLKIKLCHLIIKYTDEFPVATSVLKEIKRLPLKPID